MLDVPTPRAQQVEADADLRVAGQRQKLDGVHLPALGIIAAGGMVGALARYGLAVAFPHAPRGFPWATFATNVAGCALIGVLMVLVEWTGTHRLFRPFVGTGVLGGFTTFSTHIVEVQQALDGGAAWTALLCLAGTLLAALGAVWAGSTLTLILARRLGRTDCHGARRATRTRVSANPHRGERR